LSRYHLDHPLVEQVDGVSYVVNYEPAESTTPMFGGNSNWRGPIWFPLNYLLIEALRRFGEYYGDGFTVECPAGSGEMHTLAEASNHLGERLISLFMPDESGRRPVNGDGPSDGALFYEYFHGDTGRGLGASHQTGWTALVANLIADGREPAGGGADEQ
jgi:hypothetical protein